MSNIHSKERAHSHNSIKVNVQEQSNLQRHSAVSNLYGLVCFHFNHIMPQFAQPKTTIKPLRKPQSNNLQNV